MANLIELEHKTEGSLKVQPDNILSITYTSFPDGTPAIKVHYKKGGVVLFPKTENNTKLLNQAMQEKFNQLNF